MIQLDLSPFQQQIDGVAEHLRTLAESYRDEAHRYPDELDDLFKAPSNLLSAFERFTREDRQLKVGIVGQVKAGKSTLLNALLFEGEEVLAKAATPMTAALTRLRYGSPRAVVHFYTPEDWATVQQEARAAYDTDAAKAARALIEMARSLDVPALLREGDRTIVVDRPEDLRLELRQYVGADGRYTPLVKQLELYLPFPALELLDIVDTPGLNDPIVSRSRLTLKYLQDCDVVFLLSLAERFLDEPDLTLARRYLPNAGVARCVVVGTKMDSLLMDEVRKHRADPRPGLVALEQQLRSRAAICQRTFRDDPALARILAALDAPLFISAMGEIFHLKRGRLSEEEQFYFDRLQRLWPQTSLDLSELRDMGNLQAVREALESVASHALPLRMNKLERLAPGAQLQVAVSLEDMREAARADLHTLEYMDAHQLGEQQQALNSVLRQAQAEVADLFDALLARAEDGRRQVCGSLESAKKAFTGMQTITGSRDEAYTTKGNATRHHIDFDLFDTVPIRLFPYQAEVEVTRTRPKAYRYARLDEAVGQLERFAQEAQVRSERYLSRLLDPDTLQCQLVSVMVRALEGQGDRDTIAEAVRRAVKAIRLPKVRLRTTDYVPLIARHFSGEVEEENVEALNRRTSEVLDQIATDLTVRLDQALSEFRQVMLAHQEACLEETLVNLNQKLDRLQAEMADKALEAERYRALLARAEADIQSLRGQVSIPI